MRIIPRSLAFDMLFRSNNIDAHSALDNIYNGFEKEIAFRVCGNCKYYGVKAYKCYNKESIAYNHDNVKPTDGCNKWEKK